MGGYSENYVIAKYGQTPQRGKRNVFVDDFAREALAPTGYPTLYTVAETGAAGQTAFSTVLNRVVLTTDSTGAGDDQDMRVSGFRFERNYCSLITGMTMPDMQTSQLQLDIPFSLSAATDIEMFIGIHNINGAITALPTTARHAGIYCDISAGANFMMSSADGTTQGTTDTTIAVDTSIHIMRITWTGEDAATLQLYSSAGAAQGTARTVAALNGSTGGAYSLHWFVQTEAAAAKAMTVYPWRAQWT